MGGPTPVASGEGQTYCLRWNNHQTNLVQILQALHEVGSYVDCTLVVDDEQFKAHRVVLAANSPYFQAILQDVPLDHCSIILPGVKGFEIAALLQYMYTGETTVTKSQEPEILRTAKELQVKGLYDNLMKFNHKSTTVAAVAEERSQSQQFQGSTIAAAHSHHHHHHHHSAPTSSSSNGGKSHNGAGAESAYGQHHHSHHSQHNSSSVISTSTHISPSAAISSSCSPPPPSFGSYQPPYSNYPASSGVPININAHIPAGEAPLTPTHSTPHGAAAGEAGQWPLSPSAAAAAMLNSVYESAADMNPLKRKKLSAISSMLLNTTRDTPILRNVLAQANPADSSQSNALLLPGVKNSAEKTPTHQHQLSSSGGGGSAVGAGSHSFNGSDYGGDKEPLSPHTDRSFDEETSGAGGKKPEWKRYKQYTRADMMCAIQCVREGMSALQASRKFGLPSRTLYDKVRKLNITTGRGTHRTPKRSPPGGVGGAESSAAFPYSAAAAAAAAAHNYGHTELERESKEHGHGHGHGQSSGHGHHSMPPTIPHSAAALLDHAFLQQALENRGGDIAGREALHAMALAAAAHAAANRMSNSPPGSNGHAGRSPAHYAEQEELEKHGQRIIKREAIEEERDADDEDDHDQVEDLSLARKERHERPESPYSPPPPRAASPMESASVIMHSNSASVSTNGKEPTEMEQEQEHEIDDYSEDLPASPTTPTQPSLALGMGLKRELLSSEEAAQARTD